MVWGFCSPVLKSERREVPYETKPLSDGCCCCAELVRESVATVDIATMSSPHGNLMMAQVCIRINHIPMRVNTNLNGAEAGIRNHVHVFPVGSDFMRVCGNVGDDIRQCVLGFDFPCGGIEPATQCIVHIVSFLLSGQKQHVAAATKPFSANPL
jgi:hypothetical protein